jgi:hypothetical protein
MTNWWMNSSARLARCSPDVVIQFEDFANHNAFRLLENYRDRICTFNDDIQGTASVAVAGLFSALRVTGGQLTNQRLLFLGAGEAATGIAELAVAAMVAQGMDAAVAQRNCWLFDSKGLVVASRDGLAAHKLPFAHEAAGCTEFTAAIRAIKPTAIIGVSAMPSTFNQAVIELMCQYNERPIVFALSNPTSRAECTAQEAYEWSGGKALFASGSPFAPDFTLGGQTFVPRQGNNSYIFPGVGLGAIAVRTRRVTDEMFLAAARALAAQVTPQDLAQGSLYPPLASVRDVSAHIAASVAEVACLAGRMGWLVLPEGLRLLEHPWVLGAAGLMLLVEFFADKIPLLDSVWDTVHTFIRIPAGAALAAMVFGGQGIEWQTAVALLGGTLAAGTHLTKAGTRAMINASPEPFSNIAASFGEDVVVLTGIWLMFAHPWLMLALLLLLVVLIAWLLPKIWRGLAGVVRGLSLPRASVGGSS